jgi:hypothetical protein
VRFGVGVGRNACGNKDLKLTAQWSDALSIFGSPRFALGFGIFIALAETVRRWGNWPFLPFLLDDWIAGLFLIYGAVQSRRNWATGRPIKLPPGRSCAA